MGYTVERSTPPGAPAPIGPYNHIARAGPFLQIGGVAGVDPATGQLVDGVYARIIDRLPTKMRRTVEAPVGVEPLFLLAGAGVGLYVRLKP